MSDGDRSSDPTPDDLQVRWYRAETERLRVLGSIAARFAPKIGDEWEPAGHEVEVPPTVADARDRMLVRIFNAIGEQSPFADSTVE